jgi:hypothetical protein
MEKWRRWWALVAVFLVIHLVILCYNQVTVPFTHGYDWPGHLAYLHYVAEHWRVPPPEASAQFFNPPLYYFAAAGLHLLLPVQLGAAGQVLNLVCAAAAFAMIVAIARRVWYGQLLPTAWLLGFYVFSPTVYRAFGMVRPEPMLITLFTGGMLLVSGLGQSPRLAKSTAVSLGLLAAAALMVRQWGAFFEAGLVLWLVLQYLPSLKHRGARRELVRALGLQIGSFIALSAILVLAQGRPPFLFNAPPQSPEVAFLADLEVTTLFTRPVRPALDYRFWPVLYADYWGDYWRYWREALIHDPMPSSPATVASLVRSMWAAIPASALVLAGLLRRGRRGWAQGMDEVQGRVHDLARVLVVVSVLGFAVFALRYAVPGKGDTVKSVYLVYLVPFLAWLASAGVDLTLRRAGRYRALLWLPLGLLAVVIGPNCFFLPAEEMLNRTWQMPHAEHVVGVSFGQHITLAGYSVSVGADGEELNVTLVWTTDAYVDAGYKVFVHALDGDGTLLGQSDSIPADWTRPTQAWLPGEYIVDLHHVPVARASIEAIDRLVAGLYDEEDGVRLKTDVGGDHYAIEIEQGGQGWRDSRPKPAGGVLLDTGQVCFDKRQST